MIQQNANLVEHNPTQTTVQALVGWLNQHYPELSVVLYDIGARHGIHYHYRDLLNLNHFKGVGFEPDSQEAARLQAPEKGLAAVYPFAIGKIKETRTIYLTRHPGCSSLYPPNQDLLSEYSPHPMFEVINQAQVDTTSLDEFIQTDNPPLPDFVKIDTQGAEYDILQGATKALSHVTGVFLEAHLRQMYTGTALFSDIHRMLKDAGFRLIRCANNPNYAGEILELDVAYVRGIETLATPEKLLSAVLFCVVHDNLKFAAHLVRQSSLSVAQKQDLCELLSQPLQPDEWVLSADGTFNQRTVNLDTIEEQWR